jgi:hypothetical protein
LVVAGPLHVGNLGTARIAGFSAIMVVAIMTGNVVNFGMSTDPTAEPTDIIADYVCRWQLEVTDP